MTRTYEFRVDGRLTDEAREAFCDMRIEELPVGARLYGEVIDDAHLLGIMVQCRTLGLVVISANRACAGAVTNADEPGDGPATGGAPAPERPPGRPACGPPRNPA
jgi:hypothetical protein